MASFTRNNSGDSGEGGGDAASSASTAIAVNLADIANVALGSDAVRYEGWVSKSSRHLGAWRDRWLVLRCDDTTNHIPYLWTFRVPPRDLDAADLRQAATEEVALNGATTQIVEYQGSRPHGVVVHALRREYFFAAEDADEQLAWVREIARACARVVLLLGGAKLSPLPSSPPSSIATPMLAATPTDARSPILAAAAAPSFDDVDFDDSRLMATAAAAFGSAAARRAWNGWAAARGAAARSRSPRAPRGRRARGGATLAPSSAGGPTPPTRRARARSGQSVPRRRCGCGGRGRCGPRRRRRSAANRDGAQGGRRLSLLRAPPGLHHVGGNHHGAGRSSRARAARGGGDEPARPPRRRQRVARGGGGARGGGAAAASRRLRHAAPGDARGIQRVARGGGEARRLQLPAVVPRWR